MKHTPGPWAIAGVHVDRGNIQIGSPEDYIAEVYGAPNNTEAYANAKLMAAALDLLQACKIAEGFLAAIKRGDEMDIKGEASIVLNSILLALNRIGGQDENSKM